MIARNATISIYGLYLFDPTLFDDLQLPTGVDRDELISNLVMECAELELLYPDGDYMKYAIGAWSKKENHIWQKLEDTMDLEYNPIWNKDGTVKEIREIESSSEGKSGSLDQVSAYNETGFHNAQQNTGNSSGSGKSKDTFTRQEYGNIGVTTSQQMVKEELELRKFCIDDYIISSFKARFCLLLY